MASSRTGIVLAIVIMVFAAQCCALAATAWTQLPTTTGGIAYSAQVLVPSIVADDWVAGAGDYNVTGLTLWGAFWNPSIASQYTPHSDSLPNAANGAVEVTLKMWANASPTAGLPFNHPGGLEALWAYTTTLTGTSVGPTTAGREVYQYDVVIPQISQQHIVQGQASTLWLSVQATILNPLTSSPQWGWMQAAQGQQHGAQAVEDFKGTGWYTLADDPNKEDTAFKVITSQVPEPSAIVALGSGLIGLVGFGLRRRRS